MERSDFHFRFVGHGHYKVTYTTPTGRVKKALITDMELIDNFKNRVLKKDLVALRRAVNINKN
jgi:hypothetical protein